MSQQKKLTKYFFNKVSDEWSERTYDPAGTFLKFPSNRARMETALRELNALKLTGNVLDIGCGNGEFTIELLKRNLGALGIDIAERMIANAKENFRSARVKGDPARVFRTMDLADLPHEIPRSRFAAAAGLGLLEYLETDTELFRVLQHALKRGGSAFIECRNKFFNLFSANRYTSDLAARGELKTMIEQLAEAGKYSPRSAEDVPRFQQNVSEAIADFLVANMKNRKWFRTKPPIFSSFPKHMIRRQHTPQELEASAIQFGFRLKHVVYWHCHPYPPAWEKEFPAYYNKLSYLMTPLGYTPLGAWMCSSFLAVLEKK